MRDEISVNPYRHLLLTVLLFGFLMLLTATSISTPLGVMLTLALFSAAMQLTAMWSVQGPASYLINCFWSLLAGLLVGVAALAGCHLGSYGLLTFYDSLKLMSFGPMIWCIAQAPYWACRECCSTGGSEIKNQAKFRDRTRDQGSHALHRVLCHWVGIAPIRFKSRCKFYWSRIRMLMVQQFLIPVSILSAESPSCWFACRRSNFSLRRRLFNRGMCKYFAQ